MSFTFYVYTIKDITHIATIRGNSADACEDKFDEIFGDDDRSWTYRLNKPTFFGGVLRENPDAEEIMAEELFEDAHYQGAR